MSHQKNFKKLEESKLISGCVICMACSLKKDLLATGTTNGEVVLNRAGCTWHKVWTLAPVTKEAKPSSLSFRPDSKVLAIGYNIGKLLLILVFSGVGLVVFYNFGVIQNVGKLLLCTIEKNTVIHTHVMGDSVTISYLLWLDISTSEEVAFTSLPPVYDFQYVDCQSVFLPKLPPNPSKSSGLLDSSKKDEQVEDGKGVKGQEQVLNMLLVCDTTGHVTIYGYGLLKLISLSFGAEHIIDSVCMSSDMSTLSVLALNTNSGVLASHLIDARSLQGHYRNIRILSFQYGYYLYLLEYLHSTLKMMLEQWEDGLSVLERHLTKVAIDIRNSSSSSSSSSSSPPGPGPSTVSDALLSLLVVGECSEPLLMCLQHQLTDKLLKKLASSTDTSYNTLLKLILRYLMPVSHALFYRIADLAALARMPEGITLAGVHPDCVVKAQSTLAAFMMKTTELHEVIEKSLKIFKAFFKFLSTWSLRLSNDAVPAEMSSMSEEEIWSVAEFFREQAEKEKSCSVAQMSKKNLSFDRVRQYLRNADLKYPEKLPEHEWSTLKLKLLEKQKQQLFYPDCPNKSLIQLHKQFVKEIELIYELPYKQFSGMLTAKQATAICMQLEKMDLPEVRIDEESPQVAYGTKSSDDPNKSSATIAWKHDAFVANQCIVKEHLYTVMISKNRHKSNCMLVMRQCIDKADNKVMALKLLSSQLPNPNTDDADSRFEDVHFFIPEQCIDHSLCILLSEKELYDSNSSDAKDAAVSTMDDGEPSGTNGNANDMEKSKTSQRQKVDVVERFIPHLMMVPISALISYMCEIELPDNNDISQLIIDTSVIPTITVQAVHGVAVHKLENMLASQLIVNSDRNVICVLHSYRRRFRILEFGDIEDNDGDETDISNTTNE